MLGASNLRQQRRLWQALERPDMAKHDNEAREDDRDREAACSPNLEDANRRRMGGVLQARHVPAARVRNWPKRCATRNSRAAA